MKSSSVAAILSLPHTTYLPRTKGKELPVLGMPTIFLNLVSPISKSLRTVTFSCSGLLALNLMFGFMKLNLNFYFSCSSPSYFNSESFTFAYESKN